MHQLNSFEKSSDGESMLIHHFFGDGMAMGMFRHGVVSL